MPKMKDFFSKLKEQGKINNQDFDTFLSALTDADVPDAVVQAIEENFFTLERALAHKDIAHKIKRETLNPVDNELKTIFEGPMKEFVDPAGEIELKKDANTFNKLKLLAKMIPDALSKSKLKSVPDEETRKKLEVYENNIRELSESNVKKDRAHAEALAAQKAELENHLHDYKLNTELQLMGNKFTLAEAYEQNRGSIAKMILTDLRGSNNLRLGEKDGQHFIQVVDESGNIKFNGTNTPVTIESLLEEKYKPFLKQSEGGSTGGQNSQSNTTTVTPRNQNPAIRQGHRTTVV